jgi:DNA-binding transcriptional ArsR family regulator
VSVAGAQEVATCRARDLIPVPDVTAAVAAATLLADPTRASILRMLADSAYCVCEMAATEADRPQPGVRVLMALSSKMR